MAVLNTTLLTSIPQGEVHSAGHNESGYDYMVLCESSLFMWIALTLATLSGVFGLLGNGKVIWLLGFCIKRNPFMTYVLNLAVADFCTVLMVSAIFPAIYVADNDNDTHHTFLFWRALLFYFSYNASIYLLTAISVERCLSVLFPIWYRCRRPERSSGTVSFLLWVLSGLLTGIGFLFLMLGSFQIYLIMFQIMCIVNLLIFTPLMIGSALILLIKICRSSQRRHPARMHAAILITLLFFLIFAIPLSISNFISFSSTHCEIMLTVLLASFNSSINPLIYFLVGRDRKQQSRESVKVVLEKLFTDFSEGNQVTEAEI